MTSELLPQLGEAVVGAAVADDPRDQVKGIGRVHPIPTAIDDEALRALQPTGDSLQAREPTPLS
jgi:hypothetical protein